MTILRARGIITAFFCATAVAACSSTGGSQMSSMPAPARAPGGGPAAVAQARADSARHPYTEADIHFMSGMIGHHAQAIVMARWAPTHEASPAIRRLADRIINAQQDEIASMQRWLADRQLPVPEARPTGMRMMMNGVEHDMLMPGMLTDEEMAELDKAKGAEFDRLFLIGMIKHHQGAIDMVDVLFKSYGSAQDELVFKFASDVYADQSIEIDRMNKMLEDAGRVE